MKIVIAGSRNLKDQIAWMAVVEAMNEFPEASEIISGKATGIDTLGEQYARLKNIPVKEMPADWNRHGKAAGPIRNKQMAEYCDAAVVVWDGYSPGSKNMIDTMRKLNKKCIVRVI